MLTLVALVAACAFVRFGYMALKAALVTPTGDHAVFSREWTVAVVGMVVCALVLGYTAEVLLP